MTRGRLTPLTQDEREAQALAMLTLIYLLHRATRPRFKPGACTCGHHVTSHEHYKRSYDVDCAFCLCPRYKRMRWYKRWRNYPKY